MRKTLCLLLVLVLLVGAQTALAEHSIIIVQNPEPAEDPIGVQAGTELNVGMVTAPDGFFATDQWGDNIADLSIRALLHGYDIITSTRDGSYLFDGMAVASVSTEGNGTEHKKYTITFMIDLTYNDGTPITAKDYVFSLLLASSPLIEQLGGTSRNISQFLGYEAYLSGEKRGLAGVRLLSDHSISIEVDPNYLPYYYGIEMLDITPYPISVIAPGCDILDDGDGCYISGEFNVERLQKTLMDPETGYLFNPRVTSGPYQLNGFDHETGIVSLDVNPAYLGNYLGVKPHIEHITLRESPNDRVAEMLYSGEINLASELISGDVISELRSSEAEKGLQSQSYARSGLAYLALACENGVTADPAVRLALAQCIDKASIIDSVSPHSLAVNGYYGLGQWMPNYQSESDEEEDMAIDMRSSVEELAIPFDLVAAHRTLEDGGWNLDANGDAYQSGVRYRQSEEGLVPLRVHWAKTQSSTADKIREVIEPSLVDCGFDLTVTEMPFTDVLSLFYRQKDRSDFNMFFLASDFKETFDPYYEYQADAAYQGTLNTSGLHDDELVALADAIRKTNATDTELYVQRWFAFQQAWVQKLPLIPLYSNVYFDFYAADIQGYDNLSNLSWGHAAPHVYIGEPTSEPPSDEDSEGALAPEDDDEMIIME